MFSIHGNPAASHCGINRRELLRIGGLHLAGLSLPALLSAPGRSAISSSQGGMFGRAKNVIYLWLQGGPPQHETFDPKPDAPAEIRGLFKPISTNVPGIQFCELLPRTARIADKLAVIRSMSTDDNLHDGSGYWLLTGHKYNGINSRQIRPTDWPYFGSIVKMLRPSENMPPLTSVWIPDMMRLNDNVQPAGQTAGFLGQDWEPERFVCDPSQDGFQIDGLRPPAEVPPLRLMERVSLLSQVQRHFEALERGAGARGFDRLQQQALDLLTSGKAREAFSIEKEPEAIRNRYGRHKWGQTVLLARRLIEAGVRLVHVNWVREGGDTAVNNPMWDTHTQNADRLQDVLCPQFDVGFTALMEDLDQRGLLDETLVVVVGEFGRTPKINAAGGRDHWGPVFSLALAGAGISGGQVYGASDGIGAYPAADRVEPPELTATIFHLLGIDHHSSFRDREGRLIPITKGDPLYRLLGTQPATNARVEPGGDINFVPPFEERLLHDTDFEYASELPEAGPQQRIKGWRASPAYNDQPGRCCVSRIAGGPALSRSGERHVAIGFGFDGQPAQERVPQGKRFLLVQEVCNPRAGRFTFRMHAALAGSSNPFVDEHFLRNFTCRLEIFGFTSVAKHPTQVRMYGSVPFEPPWSTAEPTTWQSFAVSARLRSQDDGAGEIEQGVGVAVVVEKTSPGELDLAALDGWAAVRIDDALLEFDPRPRDEKVMV